MTGRREDYELGELLEELERRQEEEGYKWMTLLPTQREAVEADARVKLVLGGNGAGKSVTGMYELNLACLGEHPARPLAQYPKWRPPVTTWLGSDSHTGNKAMIPTLQKMVPKKDWNPILGPRGEFLGNRYENGSLIEGKSYDAKRESFQRAAVVLVNLDEESPESIFEECYARGSRCDGILTLTMTAVRGMSWPYRRLYLPGMDPAKREASGIRVFKLSCLDAPWISEKERNYMKAMYSPQEYRIRVLGEFIHRQGLVYEFSDDVHTMDPWSKLPPGVEIHEGTDPGFHHWAYNFYAIFPDGRIVQFDEFHLTGATPDVVQEHVKAKRDFWGYKKPRMDTLADPHSFARPEDGGLSIADQLGMGKFPVSVRPGYADHNGGIMRFMSYLRFAKDHLGRPASVPFYRVTRNCTQTIQEFQNYMWAAATANPEADKTSKKDDHHMDINKWLVLDRPEPAAMIKPVERRGGFTLEEYRELSRRQKLQDTRPQVRRVERVESRIRLGF